MLRMSDLAKGQGGSPWWKAVPEEVWRGYRPLVTWSSTKAALLKAGVRGAAEVEDREDSQGSGEDKGEKSMEEEASEINNERKFREMEEKTIQCEDKGIDVEKNEKEYVCEVGRDLKMIIRRKGGK